MEEKKKYFLLNNALAYRRGYMENMDFDDGGIQVREGKQTYAAYLSRVMDCGEEEMVWHRFTCKNSGADMAPVRITFYASDSNEVESDGSRCLIQDYLRRTDVSIEEKKAHLSSFRKKEAVQTTDILLHEVCGRYFWFLVELYRQNEYLPRLSDMMVYFPKQSWLKYLPEIYEEASHQDSFLERYLGIFQSLYEELEYKIVHASALLDPESTEKEFLSWLASWLDIEDSYIWSENQLRYLLLHAKELFALRGTKEGILRFVKLYTGEDAFVVEQHQIDWFRSDIEKYTRLKRLYGDSPYEFSVLIKEAGLEKNGSYHVLQKIIEDIKPAYMNFNIVSLKPYIFLGSYSYLGVNSVLERYRPLLLDGSSMVPFSVVSKGSKEESEGTKL